MPIPEADRDSATERQRRAGRDPTQQVRLVAGPGSGKSSSIEDRVYWLITAERMPPARIFAISFTRASTADLRGRIDLYCASAGIDATNVNVSTVHSLALRLLRRAGLLARFPAGPSVLDEWEIKNIFNAELSDASGITPTRCEKIRRYHEAMWSTGIWDPPNYIPPDPPITAAEVTSFTRYHGPATETYACVLPGEIVRQCVEQIDAGLLAPTELVDVGELIVDEYQDLNPFDQLFVERLTTAGVRTFVAGDDDQSIYSFRFASPSGIQSYVDDHPGAASHTLDACFRSTPMVIASAETLIERFSAPGRIPKDLSSLYENAAPAVRGLVRGIQYADDRQEARAIAESCSALITAGVAPRQILILLSYRDLQASQIEAALNAADVPHEMPTSERFVDQPAGRALLALARIIADPHDYVAHRTLLGIPPGVGIKTCRQIEEKVVAENRNYRDLFYGLAPLTTFTPRHRRAIGNVEAAVSSLVGWQGEDRLEDRQADLLTIIDQLLGPLGRAEVGDFISELPGDIEITELRDYLWAAQDEAQARILLRVHQRAGRDLAEAEVLPARVRVMTMHGAKGLSAQVVFVPGLEEQLLPGEKRSPYPGLVLEAARLLYVSITRARAACVLSYSTHRAVFGRRVAHSPSRYLAHVGVRFAYRAIGLTAEEIDQITQDVALL